MQIVIFTVHSPKGNLLRDKLQEALGVNHLPFQVKAVYNLDEFIKAGLSSIPAFKVGEKIFEHAPHDSFDETIQKVIDWIQVDVCKNIHNVHESEIIT